MFPHSSSLFHFTKSINVLQAVLKAGFWPKYCLEDVQWQNYEGHEFVAFPMVCFCDIPISRISDHVAFYGSFGIGLTKEWGAKNGLNPVMYFAGDNPVHKAVKSLTQIMHNLLEPTKESGLRDVRYILAHSKPTSGRMLVSGEQKVKEFYQESEWRFVPINDNIDDHLLFNRFQDHDIVTACNEKTLQFCPLKFLPTDVRYIFVPTDSDIPVIMNFLQAELDHYQSADLKVLMSRVTSLESISKDL